MSERVILKMYFINTWNLGDIRDTSPVPFYVQDLGN